MATLRILDGLAGQPVRGRRRRSISTGSGTAGRLKGIPHDRAARSRAPALSRRTEAKFPKAGRQPLMRPDGQAPPEEGDSKTTAQRSERRRGEISYRRVPTGREVLEVFQDAGLHPKAADDLHTTAARAVACHSDRSRPGVGDEMLKSAGEPGSHHLLRRQQRQDSEKNDAAPGEDAK
jgi:hypothetical protein